MVFFPLPFNLLVAESAGSFANLVFGLCRKKIVFASYPVKTQLAQNGFPFPGSKLHIIAQNKSCCREIQVLTRRCRVLKQIVPIPCDPHGIHEPYLKPFGIGIGQNYFRLNFFCCGTHLWIYYYFRII